MKNTLEKIVSGLEDKTGATWSVYDCGGGSFEFSTYSPAGENVIISLDGSTLAELAADAQEAAEAFDAEEHAAQILVAKRAGTKEAKRFYAAAPNSLRELLEDAEAIKALHESLAAALRSA